MGIHFEISNEYFSLSKLSTFSSVHRSSTAPRFHHRYSTSVPGMKRHSLVILCYYLCTLFDMAALHFP